MRRECDMETVEDFLRYYTRGYIGIPSANGEVLPFTPGVQDGRSVIGNTVTKVGEKIGLEQKSFEWKFLKEIAEFGRPLIGAIESGPTLIYGSYGTERNTARGLRLSKARFADFNSWHLRNVPSCKVFLTYSETRLDLIWNAFNKKYFSASAAFGELERGARAGCPLSINYGAFTLPDSQYPLLSYKKWTLGYLDSPFSVRLNRQFSDYAYDIGRKLQIGVSVL